MGCATVPKFAASPETVRERNVRFPAGHAVLEGRLCMPAEAGDKVPAVLLAHGSGPQSRDGRMGGQLNMGFGFEIPVHAELAWRLCESGFAVLRYDKRTCGRFNKCADNDYERPASVLPQDFVGDMRAALAFLAESPHIDAKYLFVLGHSQSAQFVPGFMRLERQVAGGIMVAAPFQPVDKVLLNQLKNSEQLLRELDVSDAVAEVQLKPLREMVRDLKLLREGRLQKNQVGNVPVEFWRAWIQMGEEAPTHARALRRPLLVLSGDYDWNVPPVETRDWEDRLEHSKYKKKHQVHVLPRVTHALNEVTERRLDQVRPTHIGRHVSPAVHEAIASFLRDVVSELKRSARPIGTARAAGPRPPAGGRQKNPKTSAPKGVEPSVKPPKK